MGVLPIPMSLHTALKTEAARRVVSLKALVVSKLSELVPAETSSSQ